MEKEQAISRDDAREVVSDLIMSVTMVCGMADAVAPGSKDVLLNVFIEELEKVAGRKKPCIDAGMCRDKSAENRGESQVLNFGQAFCLLKDGCRLARKEWGAGEAVILITNPMHGKGEPQDPDDVRLLTSVLARETASSFLAGWHPSRRDLLAEDWYVVK